MTETAAPALTVEKLSKTFGAQRALIDIELSLQPGEVRALVGENGSGKSTLVKILAGIYRPDDGAVITVAGEQIKPGHAAHGISGLRFVHQDLGLVGNLDSIDNLALGHGYRTLRRGRIHLRREAIEARAALTALGHDIDVYRPVAELAGSEQTSIAVARALSPQRSAARVLVLDEPTANLPAAEVERLCALVRHIQATGVAVLFISHHFDEVFGLADSVTVLRDGRIVGTRPVGDLDEAELVRMVLGRSVGARQQRPVRVTEDNNVVLRADRIGGGTVRAVDLEVRAGEIVGVAGITGSGREELAGLLFGTHARTGTVAVHGRPIPANQPYQSIAMGLGLVPADRRENAMFAHTTLRENLTVVNCRPNVVRGVLRPGQEKADARAWLKRLQVRPLRTEATMAELSGGNQQKVILARWLRENPKVLVLDEPTQGVDVGAKAEIHLLLQKAAADGMAILVLSTDHDELAHTCHRVLVLRSGQVIDEICAPHVTADGLTACAVGTSRPAAVDLPEPARQGTKL
jgi:ribose transport system ATP-binding protein